MGADNPKEVMPDTTRDKHPGEPPDNAKPSSDGVTHLAGASKFKTPEPRRLYMRAYMANKRANMSGPTGAKVATGSTSPGATGTTGATGGGPTGATGA